MPNEYIEDFFENIYNAEIEQKQKLDSADSFLVGIVGALIGVGAYYLQLMAKAKFGCATCFLWIFGVPYFLSLLVALAYIIASIWPRYKAYISSPQEWADYVDGFEKYHSYYHAEPEANNRVANELAKLRRQQYIEAGETNRELIIKKHAYQTKAKHCIVAAVVCMLLSALPIYFVHAAVANEGTKNEQPTKPTDAPVTPNPAPVAPDTAPATAPGTNGSQVSGGGHDDQAINSKE